MSNCIGHVPMLTGERYGHCGACHRNFIGLTAFEKHRRGPADARYCIDPETDTATTEGGKPLAKWWADAKGQWHEGERGYFDRKKADQ